MCIYTPSGTFSMDVRVRFMSVNGDCKIFMLSLNKNLAFVMDLSLFIHGLLVYVFPLPYVECVGLYHFIIKCTVT